MRTDVELFEIDPKDPPRNPLSADKDLVSQLQARLQLLGYDIGKKTPDGVYDDALVAAVKRFQHKRGIGEDGKAGKTTLDYINQYVAAHYEKLGKAQQQAKDQIAPDIIPPAQEIPNPSTQKSTTAPTTQLSKADAALMGHLTEALAGVHSGLHLSYLDRSEIFRESGNREGVKARSSSASGYIQLEASAAVEEVKLLRDEIKKRNVKAEDLAKEWNTTPAVINKLLTSFDGDTHDHKLKEFIEQNLKSDGEYNITIGRAYRDRMTSYFNGNVAMGLAAYTVGAGTVHGWAAEDRYGTPDNTPQATQQWLDRVVVGEQAAFQTEEKLFVDQKATYDAIVKQSTDKPGSVSAKDLAVAKKQFQLDEKQYRKARKSMELSKQADDYINRIMSDVNLMQENKPAILYIPDAPVTPPATAPSTTAPSGKTAVPGRK